MLGSIVRRGAMVLAGLSLTLRPAWAGSPKELPDVPADVLRKIESAIPGAPSVKPEKPRSLLVIWKSEGFYHGVTPVANQALSMLGGTTGAFGAVFTDDLGMLTPATLATFDAVVFNNTTNLKLADPAREALLAFVRDGKGVIGIHAATDNFYDWPEGAALMGGLFDGHPWNAGGTWAVKLDEPDHPLNRGFGGQGFKIRDEIYQFKDPYTRDRLRVLLSLDLSDEATASQKGKRADQDYAISWIQNVGNGRVFYCSLGHNDEVFWNKAVLQHYLDGIQFALGDLKADAGPGAEAARK
jgi:type 1 glutamine amidotransferase